MKIKKLIAVCLMFTSGKLMAGYQETGDFIAFTDRLSLRSVQNQTKSSSFQLFYSSSESIGMITPDSIFILESGKIFLQQDERLCLKCAKGGSFVPIYIKDEGCASGQVDAGYHGPYYLSMWLEYPDVSEDQKIYVRYMVEYNKRGEIGVRIDPLGNCQIIALSNIKLLP